MPETYNRNIAILGYSAVGMRFPLSLLGEPLDAPEGGCSHSLSSVSIGKTSISRYFKTNEFFLEYNPNPSQVWATKTKVDKVNFDILVYDTAAMVCEFRRESSFARFCRTIRHLYLVKLVWASTLTSLCSLSIRGTVLK